MTGAAPRSELERLVRRIEAGELPADSWDHRAHLGYALWHLRRAPLEPAARRIQAGILRLNRIAGRESAYHHTLTVAWIAAVADFLRCAATVPGESADAAEEPTSAELDDRLLDRLSQHLPDSRRIVDRYQSDPVRSDVARRDWIEPDRPAPWSDLAERVARELAATPVASLESTPPDARNGAPPDPSSSPAALRFVWALVWALAAAPLSGRALAESPTPPRDETILEFVRRRCLACHDDDKANGGVSFATPPAPTDRIAFWTRVHDQLESGRMPPANEPELPDDERRTVVERLGRVLHHASLDRQRAEGRAVLRRLNRTEYETTLRDLLGPQVSVQHLLPGDNSAAGFDNVASALDVSAVHLLRYQAAAELALRTVVPRKQVEPFRKRLSGRQVFEKQQQAAGMLNKSVRIDGDAFVQYVQPWSHISFGSPTVPVDGRYQVRISLSAVNTLDRPLPVRFTAGWDWGRAETRTLDVRDAPPDRAQVIELQVDLQARELLDVTGWTLPTERARREGPERDRPLEQSPGLALDWIEIAGPLGDWPPPGYVRLFGDLPFKQAYPGAPLEVAPRNPPHDAERLLRAFLPVAFRRPVSDRLVEEHLAVVRAELDRRTAFEEAMLLGYRTALCSPHFLFLAEPIADAADPGKLDDYAVAARLSYFLHSSTPDATLLELAARGRLARPEVLREQVERLLADPRSQRFVDHFVGQWLDLRQIRATTPDPELYGEYDAFLDWSLPRETTAYFTAMLEGDRDVAEFVRSDWTCLNERLAAHYGVAGVYGGELRRVELPPGSRRGGVLTQAAVLKVTADGTKTSPVLRGKWVLERIVGRPPAPPPPDVATIEPDIRGAITVRQQLDKHRSIESCAACHRQLDPPGLALESFDVIGGWRDFYRGSIVRRELLTPLANYPGRRVVRGPDVDPSGRTAEGRPFRDVDDYKRLLLEDRDQLTRNMVEKLVVYATGADLQFADRRTIDELVRRSRARGDGLRSLLHDVVQSRLFLYK